MQELSAFHADHACPGNGKRECARHAGRLPTLRWVDQQ